MRHYIINSCVFLFVYFVADLILFYDFYMVYTDILLLVFVSVFFTVVFMPFLALLNKTKHPVYSSPFSIAILAFLFVFFKFCREFIFWAWMPGWLDLTTAVLCFVLALITVLFFFQYRFELFFGSILSLVLLRFNFFDSFYLNSALYHPVTISGMFLIIVLFVLFVKLIKIIIWKLKRRPIVEQRPKNTH